MFESLLGIPKVEIPSEYDPPEGSVWIVAVDHGGNVSVLSKPNVHPSFFENGDSAEFMGLPPDVVGVNAGVYRWTCSFHETNSFDSVCGDEYECWFEVEKEEMLWEV